LDAVRTEGNAGVRAVLLATIARSFHADQRHEVYAEALANARASGDGTMTEWLIQTTAPHLPEELLRDALDLARAITDGNSRDRALAALAPRLSGDLASYALPYLRTMFRLNRVRALDALAPHLAGCARVAPGKTDRATADWQETIRIFAANGRQELLSGLAALMPWLEALGGVQTLREVVVAVSDVSRVWP
jgi:hypothetical protein